MNTFSSKEFNSMTLIEESQRFSKFYATFFLQAVELLKDSVQNGSDIERWLSAQCLALSGHCTDYIITELLAQTSSTDIVRQEQAAVLLWKLSHQSVSNDVLNLEDHHNVECKVYASRF